MKLSTSNLATLKHLADSGDLTAKALVGAAKDIVLTAAAEAANKIVVTGQIVDGANQPVAGVQDVVITSIPVSGAGTISDEGAGTILAGATSKQAWMQTDATGKFVIGITNIVAEKNLVQVATANGDVALLVLTFA